MNGFVVRLKRMILNSDHWLETTYYWDESSGKIAYLAISNNGFVQLLLQQMHQRVRMLLQLLPWLIKFPPYLPPNLKPMLLPKLLQRLQILIIQ